MNRHILFLLILFISLAAGAKDESSALSSTDDAGVLPHVEASALSSTGDAGVLPHVEASAPSSSGDGGILPQVEEPDHTTDDAGVLPQVEESDHTTSDTGVLPQVREPIQYSPDGTTIPPSSELLPKGGEPRVVSSVPSGYAPATGGPLAIKKTVTPVETGKGHANRLRVDVEITSIKKNRLDDAINDIDIYELVDESLNLVPPADSLSEIVRLDYIDQLREISSGGIYDHFFEIPLINYQKATHLDEISLMRLALLRDIPMSSADPISYGKIYANPESRYQINDIPSVNTTNNILTCNKNRGVENNSENLENLTKYMKENFGIKWINPSSINISYPGCSSIQMENIKISDKNVSDNWIMFMIDNCNADDGVALLNISDKMIYYLNYETSILNQSQWNISDRNEILSFNIKSLGSKDRLFYWYYVRPKKSGVFITESMLRIRDEDFKGWPDIIYPMNIEVGKPDYRFEVDPILGSTKVFFNSSWIPDKWKKLDITYVIRYTGAASNTYLKNINAEVKSADGYLYGNNSARLNFDTNNIISLNRQISYNKTGTYTIPAIWIEGTPYLFKETVTVDEPIIRWWGMINSYYTIIAALLLILVNKEAKGVLLWAYGHFLLFLSRLGFRRGVKSESDQVKLDEKKPEVCEKDATAKEEAAKEIASLIIEALERGGAEKK